MNSLQDVKFALNDRLMQERFSNILGQKAPQFMASIINAVAGNDQLQQCDAGSIISAALVASTFDLPIDSNLGFSAIVPYKGKAQFQMMYKGLVQLAIRSGYYETMNYSDVYEDELIQYNPITGELEFVQDFSRCTQRANGEAEKIAGYYAWFKLKTGFTKELYMPKAMVEAHARKYSQSYRSDLNKGKSSSKWTTDFDAMAKKTVIKQLLSKWGILSIDMQRAIQDDQKVYDQDGIGEYSDNPNVPQAQNEQVIDVFSNPQATGQAIPQQPVQAIPEQMQSEFAQFDQQFMQQQEYDPGLPFR